MEMEPDSNSKTSKSLSNNSKKSKIPSKTLSTKSVKLADEGPGPVAAPNPKAKDKNVPQLSEAKSPKKVAKSDVPPSNKNKVTAAPVPVPGILNAGSSIISKQKNLKPRPSVRSPDPEKNIGTKINNAAKNQVTATARNNSTLSKVPDEGQGLTLKPKKHDLSHNPPHDHDRDGSPAGRKDKHKTSIVKKQEGIDIDDYNAADDDPFSHEEKYVERRGTVKLTKAAYYQLYQTPISAKRIYHMKRFDPTYISEDTGNKSKTPGNVPVPDESEDHDDHDQHGKHKQSQRQHFKTSSSRANRVCCFFTKTTAT